MSEIVAEQMVKMLAEAGIQRIYAVTGDSLNYINDAVRRDDRIKWIHVRHEEVAAFAAGAEAQLTGLACCAGSSGPGHVHLINGLYDAHRSSAPVIALASTCPSSEFGTGFFQETNTTKLFDDCSCYNQLANTPAQVPRMLQQAIQHAVHKSGVAVLGIPGDVTMLPAEDSVASMNNYFPKAQVFPTQADLIEIANVLNNHEKITIFCGIGAANAHGQVIELANKLKAPVAYSYKGKMGIQHDNPYEIGMTGLLGIPSAYHSMHHSEVILLLGTDFPYANFIPNNLKIIQIDLQPEHLGRRAKLDIGVCGDIRATLDHLLPLLQTKKEEAFLQQELKVYRKVLDSLQTYVKNPGKAGAIHPEFIAAQINMLAADNAIFTVDTGMCNVWAARYINSTGSRSMLGSFNHGSMANAMPQAIGAALACPDRQVIAFCGDGGLSMLLGDLMTIVQYKLPVKIIVFNNRSLGMVKLEMEVGGLPDWQTDMLNPDFAKVAEAMGIYGQTVLEPDKFNSAFEKALAFDGPALIDVHTDPHALAMPPKIELAQMKGYALSMAKLLFTGRAMEVVDTIKSNYKHLEDVI